MNTIKSKLCLEVIKHLERIQNTYFLKDHKKFLLAKAAINSKIFFIKLNIPFGKITFPNISQKELGIVMPEQLAEAMEKHKDSQNTMFNINPEYSSYYHCLSLKANQIYLLPDIEYLNKICFTTKLHLEIKDVYVS